MNRIRSWSAIALGAIGLTLLAGEAAGAPVRALFSTIQSHPSSLVPGGGGARFRQTADAFLRPYAAPIGKRWVIKAHTTDSASSNEVIIAGNGISAIRALKKGDASPIAGASYGYFGSACGVDGAGNVVASSFLEGAPAGTNASVVRVFGGTPTIFACAGASAPGLNDPTGPTGDELFGANFDSAGMTPGGIPFFRNDNIVNVNSSCRSAVFFGTNPIAQQGVSYPGVHFDSFTCTLSSHFQTTGTTWIVDGDIDATSGIQEAVVVNGAVLCQVGEPAFGFVPDVEEIDGIDLVSDAWFVRGRNQDGVCWAVRNNVLLGVSFLPIVSGSTEHFQGRFLWATGSGSGSYVVCCGTDQPDLARNQVVVLNRNTVVARTGDPVDLDHNGVFDDDVYIRSFLEHSAAMTGHGMLVFAASLRSGSGQDLGSALLRARLFCVGDVNLDGIVGIGDVGVMISHWNTSVSTGTFGDVNEDGQVNLADLAFVIQNWAENCNE